MRGVGNKIRVYELAKELGLSSKEVTERLAKGGFSVTSASSSVDEGRARAALSKGAPPKEKGPKRVTKAEVPAKAKPAQRVKEVVETKLSPEPTVAPKPTPPPAKPAPEVRPKAKAIPAEEKARKKPVVPPPVPEEKGIVTAKPAPAPAPPRRETPPPAPKREAPPAPRVHPERPRVDAPRPAPPVAEKPAPVAEKRPPITEKKPPVAPKPAPVAERPTPAAAKPTVVPPAAPPRPPEVTPPVSPPPPKVVKIPETITVKELCEKLATSPSEIIKKLMKMGIMATVNQNLSPDLIKRVAATLGFDVEMARVEEVEEAAAEVEDPTQLRFRPPVVTVMGHVDHGKTSLLDAIRKTNVIAEEVGGITQHIGAYEVELPPDPGTKFPGGRVVFLDTPGHEAFTAMRARGAHVTDVVVLVVAADDGVMPQTIEAINHAKDAKVPILVAINKIDKPGADPNRVKQQLSEHGLIPEDWGGQTIFVEVSAKKRTGIEHLLEMLLLQAEIMELKANPLKPAKGLAIEAKLDRGRGAVATVLVQQGTLKIGDVFVVGNIHGRVRALINDKGRKVQEAGPSTPVEVLGLSGVPAAGDTLAVVADERKARQVALVRRQQQRDTTFAAQRRLTLEDLHRRIKEGEVKELRLLLKGDVQGSIEPLRESLERLSAPEVQLKVIHAAVGGISESDVMLASASNAIILGFTVRPDPKAQRLAEMTGVEIRLYNVIYDAVAEIKEAMEGMLELQFVERPMGRAEVRATFGVPRFGTVAGCFVSEGKVLRDAAVRLVRDGRVVHQGKIASLRRFKEDVREVQNGYECGIGLLNFSDIKVGDVIEAYELIPVAPKLQPVHG
ncbi:MAG: translation initiation factor IF-2 [candidate division NC10 bacterium CSP1-5]|nr:MAG: translation initiation factor IF-2 [candidate division NC10 bacterium CSP1-5]